MANIWPSITWTAKRSNSRAGRQAQGLAVLVAVVVLLPVARQAAACPFCNAQQPTLAQRREAAQVVALVELNRLTPAGRSIVKPHRALRGAERLANAESLELSLDLAAQPGSLLLLFGSGAAGAAMAEMSWHAVRVDETSYGYFSRIPTLKQPAAERLRYFVKYLEHADSLVAEDAYLEFAHATFDEVRSVSEALSLKPLRAWLIADNVPPRRKGFYGLAIGLAGAAHDHDKNLAFLQGLIVTPEDDFRAGFDGILGGYLLLAGQDGLTLIDERYLSNPRAADGDLRHVVTALRFCHEHGANIPRTRLRQSMRRLLARGEFAETAIIDLARWTDWDALETVVALYGREDCPQPSTNRAIVGYLLACGEAKAVASLARLRASDPQGVAAAEAVLSRTTSVVPAAQ